MELTFKQKVIVFSAMLGIFFVSLFIKYGLNIGESDGHNETAAVNVSEEEEITESGQVSDVYEENELMIIDVEGAVTYPGIVKISEGSRVYEAVDEAGGLLDTADTKYVNLAEEVSDGSIIYIPFKGESREGSSESPAAKKTNINTASKEELMELPGIGEAYAEDIIEHRNVNGNFKAAEDIMNVSGIGEAKFEDLKELISVY